MLYSFVLMFQRYLFVLSRAAYFSLGVAVGLLLYMGVYNQQQVMHDAIASFAVLPFVQGPQGDENGFRVQSLRSDAEQQDEKILELSKEQAQLEDKISLIKTTINQHKATVADLEAVRANEELSPDEQVRIDERLDRLQESINELQDQQALFKQEANRIGKLLSDEYEQLQGTVNTAFPSNE